MEAVFINDHPFYVDLNSKVYTSGTLSSDVWERFTKNFGHLTVVGRGIQLKDNQPKYKSASANQVDFDLLFEVRGGFDYFRYKKSIERKLIPYILKSDFIILRLPSNIGVIAANLCLKFNRMYIVEVVGCAFDTLWFLGPPMAKVLAPLVFRQNKKAIANATAAIYVTQYYLQNRYPNHSEYQINASNVVIESFGKGVLQGHDRRLKRESSTRILGMIGHIAIPYKGYESLFKALSRLNNRFELQIVGGGDPTWIKKLIARYKLTEQVFLKGRMNRREEIYEFLDNLDLYVHPSLTEGLPRSVIEAMSRGCPVIATNVGGIPELIDNEYLYNPGDSSALLRLIQEHLGDTNKLCEMGRKNFDKSKEYTFEEINGRRYEFFSEIKEIIRNQ